MRLGVLFSGGKDSCLAHHIAVEEGETVACLVTLRSENPESYLFHTPNVHLTSLQAEAMGLPIVARATRGEKEAELDDLRAALEEARAAHGIEGAVSGAVASVYQATRFQRACDDVGLWCFNPLWQRDQVSLLRELLDRRFVVMVSGVFAPPLDATWLGRTLDAPMVERLAALQRSHGINPAGEGGELETTVLWAPLFGRRLAVDEARARTGPDWGVLDVGSARLVAP